MLTKQPILFLNKKQTINEIETSTLLGEIFLFNIGYIYYFPNLLTLIIYGSWMAISSFVLDLLMRTFQSLINPISRHTV